MILFMRMYILNVLVHTLEYTIFCTTVHHCKSNNITCFVQQYYIFCVNIIVEFINLYYIDELIPSSMKFCFEISLNLELVHRYNTNYIFCKL